MPHKLGQVFLHDQNIIDKIVSFSGVGSDDHVVEIGCGDGILTKALAGIAQHLDVIEIDEACIRNTQTNLSDVKGLCPIRYHHQDFLESGLSGLDKANVSLVANIPYYISAKIIKSLIGDRPLFKQATLMVQKEFAEKLLAKPGEKDYTSLTVYSSFYFEISRGFLVRKTCFKPQPKVDSMVIQVKPRQHPPVHIDNEDLFFEMVRTAFWGRRKPFVSALKKGPYFALGPGKAELVKAALAELGKTEDCRGEVLSLEEFATVFGRIQTADL